MSKKTRDLVRRATNSGILIHDQDTDTYNVSEKFRLRIKFHSRNLFISSKFKDQKDFLKQTQILALLDFLNPLTEKEIHSYLHILECWYPKVIAQVKPRI